MSFRVSAAVAALTLIGLATNNPLSAQPQVPRRQGTNPFGSGGIFGPSSPTVPNYGVGAQGFRSPYGGAGQPGPIVLIPPDATTGTGIEPTQTSVAGGFIPTFGNYGHWYGGNYGHWYPGGVWNGAGVLAAPGGGVPIILGGSNGLQPGAFGTSGGGGLGSPLVGVGVGGNRPSGLNNLGRGAAGAAGIYSGFRR